MAVGLGIPVLVERANLQAASIEERLEVPLLEVLVKWLLHAS